MKKVLFLVFFSWIVTCPASAQVIDMRAVSRQRGFRAYQPQERAHPVYRQPAVAPQEAKPAEIAVQTEEDTPVPQTKSSAPERKKTDQTEEMKQYIATNPHVRPDI